MPVERLCLDYDSEMKPVCGQSPRDIGSQAEPGNQNLISKCGVLFQAVMPVLSLLSDVVTSDSDPEVGWAMPDAIRRPQGALRDAAYAGMTAMVPE